MIIYHIDWRYDNKDCRYYYVSPYSLKGVIHVYLHKWWANDKGRSTKKHPWAVQFFEVGKF